MHLYIYIFFSLLIFFKNSIDLPNGIFSVIVWPRTMLNPVSNMMAHSITAFALILCVFILDRWLQMCVVLVVLRALTTLAFIYSKQLFPVAVVVVVVFVGICCCFFFSCLFYLTVCRSVGWSVCVSVCVFFHFFLSLPILFFLNRIFYAFCNLHSHTQSLAYCLVMMRSRPTMFAGFVLFSFLRFSSVFKS